MAEPQTSLATAALAVLSALTGDLAVICFAALAGAMWPLSKAKTQTRWDGVKLLLRLVFTAAALTGFIAWMLEQQTGLPASKLLSPVAWAIARWPDLLTQIKDRVLAGQIPTSKRGSE